jgi:hypothetical protein
MGGPGSGRRAGGSKLSAAKYRLGTTKKLAGALNKKMPGSFGAKMANKGLKKAQGRIHYLKKTGQ